MLFVFSLSSGSRVVYGNLINQSTISKGKKEESVIMFLAF